MAVHHVGEVSAAVGALLRPQDASVPSVWPAGRCFPGTLRARAARVMHWARPRHATCTEGNPGFKLAGFDRTISRP